MASILSAVTGDTVSAAASGSAPVVRLRTGISLPGVTYGGLTMPNWSGFRVTTKSDGLWIEAENEGGLQNGVVAVLERYFGVRQYWWQWASDWSTALGTVVPSWPSIAIPALSRTEAPSTYSRTWTAAQFSGSRELDWTRRQNAMPGEVHTYGLFLDSEDYGVSNPEYFPLWGDTRHIPDPGSVTDWQPCVSNTEVQALAATWVRAQLDGGKTVVSLSVNDGHGDCTCEPCRAMDAEDADYGARTGMDRYVAFTNIVADLVAATHPGAVIAFLAYSATKDPPTSVSFNSRTVPWIALPEDRNGYTHVDAWKTWGATQVGTYQYQHDFRRILPSMGIQQAASVIQHAGAGSMHHYIEFRPQWPVSGIVSYVLGRVMWDASVDVDDVLATFYRDFYGAAAASMQTFFETCESGYERLVAEVGINSGDGYDISPAWGSNAIDHLHALTEAEAATARTALDAAAVLVTGNEADRVEATSLHFGLVELGVEAYWACDRLGDPDDADAAVADARAVISTSSDIATYEATLDAADGKYGALFDDVHYASTFFTAPTWDMLRAVADGVMGVAATEAASYWAARVSEESDDFLSEVFDAARIAAGAGSLVETGSVKDTDVRATLGLGAGDVTLTDEQDDQVMRLLFDWNTDQEIALDKADAGDSRHSLMVRRAFNGRVSGTGTVVGGKLARVRIRFWRNSGSQTLAFSVYAVQAATYLIENVAISAPSGEWVDETMHLMVPSGTTQLTVHLHILQQADDARCWVDFAGAGYYEETP